MDFVLLRRASVWDPNADVILDEEGGFVVVRVELAGIDSDRLQVFADERYLYIAGRRAQSGSGCSGSFLQKEIADGEFVKRIRIPANVAQDDVTATYADGILTVALPVSANAYAPLRTEIHMTVKRVPA